MKMLPSTKFAFASLTLLLGAVAASATDYTWTKTDAPTNLNSNWNDTANWSPTGVPNAATDNATIGFVGAASPAISLDGAYNVNNLNLSGNGGNTISIQSGSTAGTYSLTIAGAIKKNIGSSIIGFQDSNALRNFNLTANTLDFTTGGGGSYFFGRSDGGRFINSVSIANVNMGAADASTAAIRFNVTNNYNLGLVTFSGTNTKTVSLINNAAANAGYARTATVKGITQTSGTAATIEGSFRASASGTNAATLQIDTDVATSYSSSTTLTNGTGGTLALLKSGLGTQTLSGTNTYTGATTVSAGTLLINGSTASGSAVSVTGGSAASAVLGGTGTIGGSISFTTATGGILAVGGAGTIGNLTTGAVSATLASNISMELNAAATSSDLLKSSGLSATNFTLNLTNLGGTFSNGQSFQLFQNQAGGAPVFSGTTFAAIVKPTLTGGLTWDESSLYTSGTLSVVPEPATWGLLAFSLTTVMVLRRRRS